MANLELNSTTFIQKIANVLMDNLVLPDSGNVSCGPICEESVPTVLSALDQFYQQHAPSATVWIEVQDPKLREQYALSMQEWGSKVMCWPLNDNLPNGLSKVEILQRVIEASFSVVLVPTGWGDAECPSLASISADSFKLEVGETSSIESLTSTWIEHGYERVPSVYRPGQFAIRGGIVDVFSLTSSTPIRIEFFDDEIESIREFDLDTQVSIAKLALWEGQWVSSEGTGVLHEYIRPGDLLVSLDQSPSVEGSRSIMFSTSPVGNECEFEVQASPFPALNPGAVSYTHLTLPTIA